jgi:uncharacterized protein (TIGR00730 family)
MWLACMPRVSVLLGANPGKGDHFVARAAELGRLVASRGLGLVYGGASVGTMGALADAALALGGEVIGVIPRFLVDREIAHPSLTQLEVVTTMHARKARMVELSDAFIALPGGFGTLDELFEVTTWAQLGMHDKPIGIFDSDGWFSHLLAHVEHGIATGLIQPEHRGLWHVESDAARLLDALFGAHSSIAPSKVPSTSA